MTRSITSDDTRWLHRLSLRWPSLLAQAALWLILWLSLLRLPAPPSSGLDPSWRMVIGYALGHGMQWGTDLVFTYGPLGYLLAATNHGANYGDFLIWQAVSNAVFATVIWLFGRQYLGWRKVVYYAYFLFLVANYLDAMHLTMILLLVLAWLHHGGPTRRWLTMLIGIALGLLGLIKFTNLMLAGFGLVCVAGHHLWHRRWADLALNAGSFGLTFLAGWLICGQDLGNLPAYVFTSINASSGYGDGMALYEEPRTLALGLGAGLTLAAYYLLSLWRRRDFSLAVATMLIVAANSFLNWKHGFSRADGHVLAHYIACLLVPVTFPVLMKDDGPFQRVKAGLLWSAAALSLLGIYSATAVTFTDAPATWNYNLKAAVNALRILPDLKRNARIAYDDTAKPHVLPAMSRIIGNDTVDMLGNEQAYLLFNRFNYTPRPVFQTYLPYTAELLRLNEAYFRSARAPKFVIQKMDTIDYRLPALEDALSARHVYFHYSFVLEEKGMLLWRRNEPDPAVDRKTLISEAKVGFNDIIRVPERGETPIWAEVVVRPSLLGALRSFLYKAPILTLGVTEGGDFKNSFRLIRRMAEAGFLIYPHFSSGYNIQRYMAGDAPPRADTISVQLPPGQSQYYQSDITVRFYTLPPMPRSAGLVAGTTEDKFRMFDRVPSSANALYPVSILNEAGREVLFCHPPSNVEFLVNFPASRVSGRYGFAENAYRPPNATDGAEFSIEWIGPNGRSEPLMTRLLQPVTKAADRGLQYFEVALPPGGGRLVLRINSGPNNNQAYDWTYWTDIRFSN